MEGWKDGRMEGWRDGWKDGRMEGWKDGLKKVVNKNRNKATATAAAAAATYRTGRFRAFFVVAYFRLF